MHELSMLQLNGLAALFSVVGVLKSGCREIDSIAYVEGYLCDCAHLALAFTGFYW